MDEEGSDENNFSDRDDGHSRVPSSHGHDSDDEDANVSDLNRRFLAEIGVGIEIGEDALLLPTLTEFISLKRWDKDAYVFCKQKYNAILPFLAGIKEKSLEATCERLLEGTAVRGLTVRSTIYEFMRELISMVGMRPLTLAPLTIAALATPTKKVAAKRAHDVLLFMKALVLQEVSALDEFYLTTQRGYIDHRCEGRCGGTSAATYT